MATDRTTESGRQPQHHAAALLEQCETCGERTAHTVTVTLADTADEQTKEQHRKYARRPCRVVTCHHCGARTRTFVNR